ncbi:MAG: tRNA (adenosine(37)-N6)-threonylcarbamoyltransferase complex dimerization subunit type 1 TsaB [Deltaproteobacteria bacterium]|nr:tRNA (adenosine(37)-N6)-threonylcarbamoyltransferase complex dimerization subunit type 1 TsaB [Deltaproteobacteria bacterium]
MGDKALYIDTTGLSLNLSVAIDGKVMLEESNRQHKVPHSRNLLLEIDALLAKAQWSLSALDYLVVLVGPGSYTGLRIGLAATKAFALVFNRSIVPINTLEAVACYHLTKNSPLLVPCLVARSQEVYAAAFGPHASIDCLEPHFSQVIEIDELPKLLERWPEVLTFGSGALLHEKFLAKNSNIKVLPSEEIGHEPHLPSVLCLAHGRYQAGLFMNAKALSAYYLRGPSLKTK